MNYPQALAYIQNSNTAFCKPGTERVEELCRRMGDPQNKLSFIHVAGTNGKGSVCAMLEAVLLRAGLRVGVFSSPAVLDFNEQIRVCGAPIGEEAFASLACRIRPIADGMTDRPTSFELLTALAFAHFAETDCEIIVLETGLGGRTDATNVVENTLLSVITGIAKDHTAFLGDTVAAIAREKAGIIKSGRPVLFGGEDDEAYAVIAQAAQEKNAPLYRVERERVRVTEATLRGTRFDFGENKDITLSLMGLYQPYNAATVWTACEILKNTYGFSLGEADRRAALSAVSWRARFEKLSDEPLVIYDGAHNPQGIAAALASIRALFGTQKVLLVTGVLRDKDYHEIALSLASVACRAFTVTLDSPRALDAAEYAQTLCDAGLPAQAFETAADAIEAAKAEAKKSGSPVFCLGSLYLYRAVATCFPQSARREAVTL